MDDTVSTLDVTVGPTVTTTVGPLESSPTVTVNPAEVSGPLEASTTVVVADDIAETDRFRLARGSNNDVGDTTKIPVLKRQTAPHVVERARVRAGSIPAAAETHDTDRIAAQPEKRATTAHVVARTSLSRTAVEPDEVDETAPRPLLEAPRKRLGAYRITGVLASGQMGTVYRAYHSADRLPVAIKALHTELQGNPAIVARFFAESQALTRITHRNVVRFRDFCYGSDGATYLVMEVLDGETLASRLKRERRLDISTAIDIATQMAHGLAAAHAVGVIHRDLKPENVFLCADGTVKLLDFGVAKFEGQAPTHTLQGDLLGTPAYMAPEQGRSAAEADVRSDLYAVGCILFEMVCGIVPYPGTLVETLVGHQTGQRPPARALVPDVPATIDSTLDRLMARNPADRAQTAAETIALLAAIQQRQPLRRAARPRAPQKVRMRTEVASRWRWFNRGKRPMWLTVVRAPLVLLMVLATALWAVLRRR